MAEEHAASDEVQRLRALEPLKLDVEKFRAAFRSDLKQVLDNTFAQLREKYAQEDALALAQRN